MAIYLLFLQNLPISHGCDRAIKTDKLHADLAQLFIHVDIILLFIVFFICPCVTKICVAVPQRHKLKKKSKNALSKLSFLISMSKYYLISHNVCMMGNTYVYKYIQT